MTSITSLQSPPPAYQSIVDVLKEENISIHIERGSGMISMTRMFQTHGDKKPQVYTRTKRFKDMKKALEKQLNSAATNSAPPVRVVKIVNGDGGGTWIHKSLAIDAAMWLSPAFGLAVTELVERYLSGDISNVESQRVAEEMQYLATTTDDEVRDAEWFKHRQDVSKPAHKEMSSQTKKWFEIQTSIHACRSIFGVTPKVLRKNFEHVDKNKIKDHYRKDELMMSSIFLHAATGIKEDMNELKRLETSFSNLSKDLGFQDQPKLIANEIKDE